VGVVERMTGCWRCKGVQDRENYVIMPLGTAAWSLDRTPASTNPYNPSTTPDLLGIVITKELTSTVFDIMFWTELGPPTDNYRHHVSLIFKPTGSP